MEAGEKKLHIGFACFKILVDWSGIERVTARLSEAMSARGHKVSVIVPTNQGKPAKTVPISPLPDGCETISLNLTSAAGRKEARETLRNSSLDVVVAFFGGRDLLWMPWLLKNSGIPLLIAESIHPDEMCQERMTPYEHYGALMAADAIQVLLPPYREKYPHALQERITVIGNPSPPSVQIDEAMRTRKQKRTLLTVARLDEQTKRLTLLLRAWALLYKDFPDWSLTIVGDGPQWAIYNAMADTLGKRRTSHSREAYPM